MKVSKQDLEEAVARLNSYGLRDFSIGWAYGGARLESNTQTRDVSPRLSKRELLQWIHAYEKGVLDTWGNRPPKH